MAIAWGQIETTGISGGNERCVEIPLALDFLALDQPGIVLDAGCALNGHLPSSHIAQVVHLSQSLNSEKRDRGDMFTSYVAWDLRHLDRLFRVGAFHRAVCISTLEHVGMENAGYGGSSEHDPKTQRVALVQLAEVARSWLITVPYRADPIDFGKWRHWGPELVAETCDCLHAGARYWGRVNGAWVGGGLEPLPVDDDGGSETVTQIVAIRSKRD